MAPPQGVETFTTSFTKSPCNNFTKTPRLTQDNLTRTISDIAFERSQESRKTALPSVSEAGDAECDCCGMSEEYTPEYIRCVRDKFLGKCICGLCSEAVKEEMLKNGGDCKVALETHMGHCVRFNKIGRPYPVLCQAEAMRKILKKSCMIRAKSLNDRDIKGVNKGGIARSSSCKPSMMIDLTIRDLKSVRPMKGRRMHMKLLL